MDRCDSSAARCARLSAARPICCSARTGRWRRRRRSRLAQLLEKLDLLWSRRYWFRAFWGAGRRDGAVAAKTSIPDRRRASVIDDEIRSFLQVAQARAASICNSTSWGGWAVCSKPRRSPVADGPTTRRSRRISTTVWCGFLRRGGRLYPDRGVFARISLIQEKHRHMGRLSRRGAQSRSIR